MNAETKTAGKTATTTNLKPVSITALREAVEAVKTRSAWTSGVKEQALDFCDDLAGWAEYETNQNGRICRGSVVCSSCADLGELLKNGADTWQQYSEGGNSLVYDHHIARRYCTASELKRTRNGERNPNPREDWIALQARALYQAAGMVERAWLKLASGKEA